MDNNMQRACVARLEEPVFLSSSLASLIPQCGLVDSAQEKARELDATADERQAQINDATRFNGDIDETSNTAAISHDGTSHGTPMLSNARQRLHHPRPESLEIAQEEAERRTRFALEDPDESAQLIQRLLHLTDPNSSWQHDNDNNDSTTQPLDSLLPRSMYIPPDIEDSAIYVYEPDEDALAVNDPRRDYDFKDFMQRWHLDPNNSSAQDLSSLLPVSNHDITRIDVDSGEMDMQGIRWNLSVLRQEQVFDERRLRHPSNRTSTSRSTNIDLLTGVDLSHTRETQYRFRCFSPRHLARYNHYQLRNTLAATNRSEIFYSTGEKVIQTSLGFSNLEHVAIDLSTTTSSPTPALITCLSATANPHGGSYRSNRVLLAGGFGGEFAMLDLSAQGTSAFHAGFVTYDCNGIVTHVDSYPDRCSGQLRACFVSNDRKVRLMDVKTHKFLQTFEYGHALNCSAIAPDGRLRVLVGDCNETFITNAETGEVLATLREHRDDAFACAWSTDGRHVATGAQDGLVALWDARNWSKPLKMLHCGMATARSLHFTSDGALVVAEDDDLVTIYDTSERRPKQEIRFFGNIAGVALLDGGDEMIIANADRTVGGLISCQCVPQCCGDEQSPRRRGLFNNIMTRESTSGYRVML